MTELDLIEPVIEVDADRVLELLNHGDNWTQGAWADGTGKMCLHEAIKRCDPQPGDQELVQMVAQAHGWGISFNDDEGRTFDDIKQAVVANRLIFPRHMAATFGPTWALVATVVRQAAQLTPQQKATIATTWAGCFGAKVAGDQAYLAASDAFRGAGRDAATSAARSATGATTCTYAVSIRRAAGDTARAAVCRDLIGKHGFRQDHYDTLTAAWREIFPGFDQ